MPNENLPTDKSEPIKHSGGGNELPSKPLHLSDEQLARWTALVARGDAEIPTSLNDAQSDQFRHQVRILLRARLVQFIVRQIAFDLKCDSRKLS